MKKVKITFSMISHPLGGFKFKRRTAVIDLPEEIAESLESRQGKSRYVEGPYHNGYGKKPIAELIQIIAEVNGYEESVFELAEIIGDSAE
jgi:hypothetical protein